MLGRPPHPGEPGNPLPEDETEVTAYFVASPTKKTILGCATQQPQGWKFLPFTTSHTISRKHWPTAEASLPPYVTRAMGRGDYVLMPRSEAVALGILKG